MSTIKKAIQATKILEYKDFAKNRWLVANRNGREPETGNGSILDQEGNNLARVHLGDATELFANQRDSHLVSVDLESKQTTAVEPVDDENEPIKIFGTFARKNRLCLADERCLYYIDLLVVLCIFLWQFFGAPAYAQPAEDFAGQAVNKARTNHSSPREMKPLADRLSALPEKDKAKVLAALQPLLRSDNWEIQANTIYLLGALGPTAAPAAADILKAMSARMENVAWEAPAALNKIGPMAVPQIILALKASQKDSEHKEVSHLNSVVKAMGPKATATAPYIVPFLSDGHNTGAIDALNSIGTAALPAICQGFESDPKGMIAVHAHFVFEKLGVAPSTKAVMQYLNGKCTAKGKSNALVALMHMKSPPDKSIAPKLCSIMAEGNSDTLSDATQLLIRIGPAATNDVMELLSNRDQQVKDKAQEILRSFGPVKTAGASPVNVLVNKLNAQPAQEAATTAATILKIDANNGPATDRLKKMLNSKTPDDVRVALQALPKAGAGGKALTGDLVRILEHNNTNDRGLAATALGEIGPGAKSAIPALITAAKIKHPIVVMGHEGFDETSNVHQAAITSLGKIGPEAKSAIPLIVDKLQDTKENYLHKCCYEALSNMLPASTSTVPPLVHLLDSNKDEREEIIALLQKMGSKAQAAEPALRKIALDTRQGRLRKQAYETLLAVQPDANKTAGDTKALLLDKDSEIKEMAIKQLIKHPSSDKAIVDALLDGFKSNNYSVKQLSLEALSKVGAPALEILPKLIKENTGSSYSQPQKDLAFAAIKKMDPKGEKTIPLIRGALNDAFQVRGTVELLEYIGSPETKSIAAETRTRWKLN